MYTDEQPMDKHRRTQGAEMKLPERGGEGHANTIVHTILRKHRPALTTETAHTAVTEGMHRRKHLSHHHVAELE